MKKYYAVIQIKSFVYFHRSCLVIDKLLFFKFSKKEFPTIVHIYFLYAIRLCACPTTLFSLSCINMFNSSFSDNKLCSVSQCICFNNSILTCFHIQCCLGIYHTIMQIYKKEMNFVKTLSVMMC